MEKKLPEITIHGEIQELIEIEMIFIMLGYDVPDEEWNNNATDTESLGILAFSELSDRCFLHGNSSNNTLGYHNHKSAHDVEHFHISQLPEIIDYVLNYKS